MVKNEESSNDECIENDQVQNFIHYYFIVVNYISIIHLNKQFSTLILLTVILFISTHSITLKRIIVFQSLYSKNV